MAIDMVYVLGPTDPLTAEVVARARATFAANHARAYLDKLEAALGHGAYAGEGGRTASRAGRASGVPAS